MLAKYKYHIYLLIAGLSWSSLAIFSFLLTKQGVDLFSQIFYRILFSLIMTFFVATLIFKQKLTLNFLEFKYLLLNSLASLGAFTTFSAGIFLGAPIAKAIALNYAYPITIVILSYFLFKEKPTLKGWSAILLSLISVFFILEVWKISSLTKLDIGSLFELVNSVFFGFIIVFGKKIRKDLNMHPFRILFFTFLFLLLEFYALAVILNIFSISFLKPTFDFGLSLENWLSLILMSLFGNIIPLGLVYATATKVKSYVAGILLSTEPVWGYILGLILFGQLISIWAILGMIGIIIAVLLV